MKMMGGIFSYTEMGKAINYVSKVARDLIKARRESRHTEKVSCIIFYSSWLWILYLRRYNNGMFSPSLIWDLL